MIRPYALAAVAALAAIPSSADAGTCVSHVVPGRGEVTACAREYGCDVYADPGGRLLAYCLDAPADTAPLGACTDPDLPTTYQVCFLTEECTLFVTTGRPPGLCL